MSNPPTDPTLLNEYDPTVPETFESAHQVFADLRARCPVAHSTAFDGFWTVTRYQDVYDMLMQPELYITSVRNVVPGSSATGRRPPLHLDPPDHTPYRRAIDRALGTARVASIENVTRGIASRLMRCRRRLQNAVRCARPSARPVRARS